MPPVGGMNDDDMDFGDAAASFLKVGENLIDLLCSGTLLDGTKFDSSGDRDRPFKFTLGQVVLLILIPLISPKSSKRGIGFQAIGEALGLAIKAIVYRSIKDTTSYVSCI